MSFRYEISLDPEIYNIEVIEKWCSDNLDPDEYSVTKSYYFYQLVLDEESAMAFKLRWI